VFSWIFPVLFASSHGLLFLFFAAMMVVQFFVVLFFYAETKGVTLEQLQHLLGIECPNRQSCDETEATRRHLSSSIDYPRGISRISERPQTLHTMQ
jgi:hypothetical protein